MASKEKSEDGKLPEVVYKNLGTHRPSHRKGARTPFGVWVEGKTGSPSRITVDPRQSPYEMLDTIVHECLHDAQPEITEEGIVRISTLISKVLWREGYRKTHTGD